MDLPSPEIVYRDLYCARGQDENYIKQIKNDLASDRTSDHSFLANHLRLYFSCAAYVLHHTLRTVILQHTELSSAKYGHAKTLQTGGACGPLQRSYQTATAQPMPGEIIVAPCDGNPVSSATAAIA